MDLTITNAAIIINLYSDIAAISKDFIVILVTSILVSEYSNFPKSHLYFINLSR